MIEFTVNRRSFLTTGLTGLTTGLAGAFCTLGRSHAGGTALAGPILPRRFAGSDVISGFAARLLEFEDYGLPAALRRAIEVERPLTNFVAELTEESWRGAFFARLAVECLAPRALRRAGYHQLAGEVAKGMRSLNDVRQTIRLDLGDRSWFEPLCTTDSVCAHAERSAEFADYAGEFAIEVEENRKPRTPVDVAGRDIGSGERSARAAAIQCALALAQPLFEEKVEAAKVAWIWDFAVRAINTAADIVSEERCRHGVKLNLVA